MSLADIFASVTAKGTRFVFREATSLRSFAVTALLSFKDLSRLERASVQYLQGSKEGCSQDRKYRGHKEGGGYGREE